MVDIPDAKKCCGCLPLRRGLLAWVYIKLVIYVSTYSCVVVPLTILGHFYSAYVEDFLLVGIIVVHILFLLEMLFDLLFVVGAHNKSFVYLRTYYRYQLFLLANDLVMFILYFIMVIVIIDDKHLILLGGGVVVFVGLIAIHTYFIYLLRGELRKVELAAQFEFKNFPDEPECSVILE